MYNLRVLTVIIAMFAVCQTVLANDDNFSNKTVTRLFTCESDVKLSLLNKSGDISVNTWSKDEIEVVIRVQVEDGRSKKASYIIDCINFKFDQSENNVSVETIVDSDKIRKIQHENFYDDWNFKKFLKIAVSGNKYKEEIKINYEVMIPISASIDITNKYGSVYINECNEALNVDLAYGILTIDKMNSKDSDIQIGYGNVKLRGESQNTQLTIKYGNAEIENIETFAITSKYSNVKITNVKSASITSKYDKYTIDNGDNILINSGKYSKFNINGLKSSFITKTEMGYGVVTIDNISNDFKEIIIANKYSDVNLSFVKINDYDLDLYVKYGKINVNSEFTGGQSSQENHENRVLKRGSAGKVTIKNQYSDINISVK